MTGNDNILENIRGLALSVLVVFLFTPSPVQGQTANRLEIRGQAQMKATPDEVTCRLRNNVIRQDYDDALKALDRELNEIRKVLVKLDFPENEIKSKNFSIGPNRIYQRGTAKDSGFVARQDLEITFKFNKEKVLDLLNEVSDSKAQPSLSFGYRFSEETEAVLENQLIKEAVSDAQKKATLIAKSADIQLGSILRIQYDPAPVRQPQPMVMAERSMARDKGMDFGGFQVPELDLSRSVLIQWEIR